MYISLSLLMSLFYLYIYSKKKNILLLLPIFYSSIVAYSLVGTSLFSFAVEVPFDFYYKVNQLNVENTAIFFLVAGMSFFCGIVIFSTKNNISNTNLKAPNFSFSKRILNISDYNKFFIFIITLFSLIFGYGFEALLERQGYVPSEGRVHTLLIIYMLTLPVTSFALAFFKNKILKVFLFILIFVFIFGTTARMLLLLPFFYFVGDIIRHEKLSLSKNFFFVLVILFIFAFTLQFRSHAVQGVFPNIIYLINNGVDLSFINLGFNYILSYAFFATALGVQDFEFNQQAFLISINPLPSSFLDIDYMLRHQSLNQNSPLTAVSVLSMGGYILICSFYFLVGLIFERSRIFLLKKNQVFYLIAMVLFVLFTMFSVQYNLRGVARLIYYVIFMSLLAKVFNIVIFNYKRNFC